MTLAALALAGALTMPQPWGQLFRRDHILVAGMPGCGKTPFAASLAAEARRVVYFDPTGEWAELGDCASAEELADGERLAGYTLRLVVQPPDDADGLLEAFAATERACRAAARHGGLVLLADEVGDLNESGGADLLRGLHRNGHKDGIATILASPCMTDFPARCRSTASRVYSFWQKADADIQALNREYGRDLPNFGERANAWRYPAPPVAWVSPTLHR